MDKLKGFCLNTRREKLH